MTKPTTFLPVALLQRLLGRMRFPQLFLLAGALFVADLLLVDPVPFLDELLLGLLTLMLARWQDKDSDPTQDATKPRGEQAGKPPTKNVTPSGPARPID